MRSRASAAPIPSRGHEERTSSSMACRNSSKVSEGVLLTLDAQAAHVDHVPGAQKHLGRGPLSAPLTWLGWQPWMGPQKWHKASNRDLEAWKVPAASGQRGRPLDRAGISAERLQGSWQEPAAGSDAPTAVLGQVSPIDERALTCGAGHGPPWPGQSQRFCRSSTALPILVELMPWLCGTVEHNLLGG